MYLTALDSSDPIISSINLASRLQKRKRYALPTEVISLLLSTHDDPIPISSYEQEKYGKDENVDSLINSVCAISDGINLSGDEFLSDSEI